MKFFPKALLFIFVLLATFSMLDADSLVYAEPASTLSNGPTTDITKSDFQLSACDGPDLSKLPNETEIRLNGQIVKIRHGEQPTIPGTNRKYVPCDFNGLMGQIQHFINIGVVAGVLIAIFGFSYAGFLYVWEGSNPGKRKEASGIFKKVGLGFILMLSAWFIVYQIMSWLAKPGFTVLLGK